jgi:membrane fusion protein, multidrug efflux system
MKTIKALIRVTLNAVPFFVGIAVLILLVLWIAGVFTPKIGPGHEPVTAERLAEHDRTDQVHEVVKPYFEEALGSVKAADRTEISSRILAPIGEITVAAGQTVKAGDPLIRLDPREIQARLFQAQAGVTAAEATLKKTETDFERYGRLLESRAVSRSEFERIQTERNVAHARLRQAKESLIEAEVMLSYTIIKAPKAGLVVDRLAEPGDTARQGIPLLVLYDPASLRLEVPVPESLAVRLKKGDKFTVRFDALDREVTAMVDEIVPQAEVGSRSLLVKAALPETAGLFEGMFGRIQIPSGQRRHLCLSVDAIRRVGQLEYVDVVKEDNVLERRMIKTGRLGMPGKVEVLSGVEAGETVRLPEIKSSDVNR